MLKESKLEKAIKILRREGYTVTKEGNKYRCVRHPDYCPSPKWNGIDAGWREKYTLLTAREVIKRASYDTSESRQRSAVKRHTKEEAKRERSFVRDRLRPHLAEDADVNMPKRAFSDPWNWD